MDVRTARQRALIVASVGGVLAGTQPWSYDDGLSEVVIARPFGIVWTVLVLVAVGGAVYAASSWAAEHVLNERRQSDRAGGRRTGREVSAACVVNQVRKGVATPAELADALGIQLHVARRMLETLVDEGRLVERDGHVATPDRPPRAVSPAPRWIDPEA